MQIAPQQRPDLDLTTADAVEFDSYVAALRAKCFPKGACEEEAFDAYSSASHQSKEMRVIERQLKHLLMADPTSEKILKQFEGVQRLGQCYERRARQAFESLRKLQRDRIVAHAITEDLVSHKATPPPIPASLPLAAMQRSKMHANKPLYMGVLLLGDHLGAIPDLDPHESLRT
jgi:hypothetical protein